MNPRKLRDILAQTRPFVSGRSKVHGKVTYIHKQGEGDGGNTGGCVGVCLQTNVEFGVKHLDWV